MSENQIEKQEENKTENIDIDVTKTKQKPIMQSHALRLLKYLESVKKLDEENKKKEIKYFKLTEKGPFQPKNIEKKGFKTETALDWFVKSKLHQHPYEKIFIPFNERNPLIKGLPRFAEYIKAMRKQGVQI